MAKTPGMTIESGVLQFVPFGFFFSRSYFVAS